MGGGKPQNRAPCLGSDDNIIFGKMMINITITTINIELTLVNILFIVLLKTNIIIL